MNLRVMYPDEPGFVEAGLIGVRYPEQGHRTVLERGQEFPDPRDPIPESHVLVTVRPPAAQPETFLVEGYSTRRLDGPEDFLESLVVTPNVTPPTPRLRALWISLAAVVLALLVAVGVAGFTGLFSLRVVLTNSMQPTINPGDVIVTVSDTVVSPHVGDVVVYIGKTFDGTPVAPFAHRIIGGNAESGWLVKGDNNADPDVQQPTADDIESVVVMTVPWIGQFLNVQVLIVLVALIFGVWLIVDGVRDKT